MSNRWLIALLALATCGCAQSADLRAPDSGLCSTSSELECVHSPQCTLVQTAAHGGYICRAAQGRCEMGFRQASDGDIQKECEAKPGCEFKPANCYCPPSLECFCGGGPPAQCVDRANSK